MNPLIINEPVVRPGSSSNLGGDCNRYETIANSPDIWVFIDLFAPRPSAPEALFERERAAFLRMLPRLARQYSGRYVAVQNGHVVTDGNSDRETAEKFFALRGDSHVYIGFVGEEPPAYQISPRRYR